MNNKDGALPEVSTVPDSIPSADYHPSSFIEEELEARGWDRERLAVGMGGEFGINLMMLDMYFELGPTNTRVRLGERMAWQLAIAFNTSAELFLNLEQAWLRDAQGIETRVAETPNTDGKQPGDEK